MDETANPYRPGAGMPPPALLGRDRLLDRFGVNVRRALSGKPGKSVMPIGLRGVGKTVLLNRFQEIATDEGLASGFIEAPESGYFPRLLAARLRQILLELDRRSASGAVLRALRVLKTFTLHLPEGSSLSIDVDALAGHADSGDLGEDVTDLLVAVGQAARSRQRGVLLAVDEMQYLAGRDLAALIVGIHRTGQLDLPVVLVGAGLPQLPGLTGAAKSYAERLFEFPEVGSLGHDDARAALAIPAASMEVEFSDAALDRIVELARGYPYFLQEWGYHVWNQAPSSPISTTDVDVATHIVEEQLESNFFLVRFNRLTPKEKGYLRAMAALGPGPHRSGDIAAELGVRVESVAPRRSALIAKGMIYSPAHGDTAFSVPLFDQFLRRATP